MWFQRHWMQRHSVYVQILRKMIFIETHKLGIRASSFSLISSLETEPFLNQETI